MSLPYAFRTARDVYAKLCRDGERLAHQVTADDIFNFMVTAYHVMDWLRKSPEVKGNTVAISDLNNLYENTYIMVCRDFANAYKHFEYDQRYESKKIVDRVDYKEGGLGVGRFGHAAFGVGEVSLNITVGSDTFNLLTLKDEVIALYEDFFARHGL